MPRLARTVFAKVPHHITQRGNRREDIFLTNDDRETYLAWLEEYCQQHGVDILAYCLMSNHIHLVAVPTTEDGLQRVLKPLHMRYAQRFNRQRSQKGHVWQGRYFSAPLDEPYLWATLRYVERNPVRAGLVRKAERYPWSSAAAHCQLRDDPVLTTKARWWTQFQAVGDWSAWLAEGDEPEHLAVIRRNIEKGLPCGSERFLKKLEKQAGRVLQYRPQGRPRSDSKG
ncbi:MAG: transposase [Nitrospirae bacterium]|nr:transposase [Nitrospirota bacterium]MDA1305517.1 transposase [Nitrospirota bacterium]